MNGLPRGIAVWAIAAAAVACRTAPPKHEGEAEPAQLQDPVRLSPFHVRPEVGGAPKEAASPEEAVAPTVDIYDAATLFQRASAEFRRERFDSAVEIYLRTAKEFSRSEYASPSLYNAGLALERTGRYDRAAHTYRLLTQAYPLSQDVTDALFRLLGCAEALEDWEQAAATANVLLFERADLTAAERVECLARKGTAELAAGDPVAAEATLKEAVYRYASDKEAEAAVYYAAMARFKRGEIVENQMKAVQLPEDEKVLKTALEEKCQLLLDAQRQYTESIRYGEGHWAAASAYRIGKLYRTLWEQLTAAPPPADLAAEEKEIYAEILADRIRVLLQKAVRQWERVVKMAERLEMENLWVDAAREEISEIRRLMIREASGVPPVAAEGAEP